MAKSVESKTMSKDVELDAFRKVLKDIDDLYKKSRKGETLGLALLPEMGNVSVDFFSSGSIVLDNILGGGIPQGRVIEIYGPEASGKTSIALNAIADVQRKGGNCVFIDAEQALDDKYARILGVDITKLGFSQANIAEDVFDTMELLIKSGTTRLIVIDSVASLMTRQESEDDLEKAQMATLARFLSKSLKRLTSLCNKYNCTVIFLNQTRDNVGVMFGSKVTTPGGKALKFYASQRVQVNKVATVKEGTTIIGTRVKFKIVKNKVAPPFGEAETVLSFAKGINRHSEILITGETLGFIQKEGRTYYYTPRKEIKLKDATRMQDDGRIKIASSEKTAIEVLVQEKDLFNNLISHVEDVLTERRNNSFETVAELEKRLLEEAGISSDETSETDEVDFNTFTEEEVHEE